MTDIFTSITIGRQELPNRIFMAPMTRNRAPDSVPNELMKTYYTQRAGAGLIITEGTQISPQGVGYPATPGIHNDAQVTGWKTITDAVHKHGGHIFCQLWHVGRVSHPGLQPDHDLPVAPSAIAPVGETMTYEGPKPFVNPRTLDLEEVSGIVTDYLYAADCALRAGFDGVEIHAANGYLIDQFLRDGSNRRSDSYGGSIENRARFLLEVVEAVVEVWGADRVGIRLSPLQPFNDMRDTNPEATFTYALSQLNRFGLGYLHITEMGKENLGAAGPGFDFGILRDIWQGTYISNGGYDKDSAITAVSDNAVDAIAFGTSFISNPDLVTRFQRDTPLNEVDPDTFYGGDEHGYTDYPALNGV
ncbi:MAG: alkene reductase [Deltaproteobacteria bacterium]|nr:MAG: alkene reductase [Deltaproteobacteria bacterium]